MEQVPDSVEPERKRKFVACFQNGCVDGWRLIHPATRRWGRCECLLEFMQSGEPLRRTGDYEKLCDWRKWKAEHNLPADLTYQAYYCSLPKVKAELKRIAEQMAMAAAIRVKGAKRPARRIPDEGALHEIDSRRAVVV